MCSLSYDKRPASASLGDLLGLGFSHQRFDVGQDAHGNRLRKGSERCWATGGNIKSWKRDRRCLKKKKKRERERLMLSLSIFPSPL